MAKTIAKLYNGTLTNAKATLYTVPASTKTVVKSITLCNKAVAAQTVDLYLDGTYILKGFSIDPDGSEFILPVDQVLDTGDLIEGNSDANAAIDICISGYEVT